VPVLLIRHKVTNYETWRQVFLDDAVVRQANGQQGEYIFRNAADPGEVWILLEWDDLFRARLFVKSDELSDAMERAGVADRPDYWFLKGSDLP
jgi:hypothetical protein